MPQYNTSYFKHYQMQRVFSFKSLCVTIRDTFEIPQIEGWDGASFQENISMLEDNRNPGRRHVQSEQNWQFHFVKLRMSIIIKQS